MIVQRNFPSKMLSREKFAAGGIQSPISKPEDKQTSPS